MAHIKTISPDAADGRLAEVYEEVAGKRGAVAHVMQVHSLMPDTMLSHLRMYMDIMYGKGPLSRLEREAIAVVVSAANDCRYCVSHHSDALNKYMKDDDATRQIADDFESSRLSEPQKGLCRYAQKLTLRPSDVDAADAEGLREAGWDDAAILHTALVTNYFNFVNRNVLALGVELEKQQAEYKY